MSMKNIHPCELITKSCFVKGPSYDVINKIKESNEKKIILTGPSHSGKSVTLYEHTRSSINTGNDAIYITLNPCLNVQLFSNEELIYHYELMVSNYIYLYIKNNYNDIYNEKFATDHLTISNRIQKLRDYINNKAYDSSKSLDSIISTGEISEDVIYKMKNVLDIESLSIIFDRFDTVDNSNEMVQLLLSKYFSLFDKAIITTTDEHVYQDDKRRKSLLEKGYNIIDVDYGKKIGIAKRIVSADIKFHNSIEKNIDDVYVDVKNLIGRENYNNLIKQANGNFDILFNAIREFYSIKGFYGLGDNNDYAEMGLRDALINQNCVDEKGSPKKLHL